MPVEFSRKSAGAPLVERRGLGWCQWCAGGDTNAVCVTCHLGMMRNTDDAFLSSTSNLGNGIIPSCQGNGFVDPAANECTVARESRIKARITDMGPWIAMVACGRSWQCSSSFCLGCSTSRGERCSRDDWCMRVYIGWKQSEEGWDIGYRRNPVQFFLLLKNAEVLTKKWRRDQSALAHLGGFDEPIPLYELQVEDEEHGGETRTLFCVHLVLEAGFHTVKYAQHGLSILSCPMVVSTQGT
jgi:hypothetical protein